MARGAASAPVRALWLALAGACLVLAAVGVVLPVLPTTPFVLAAAFAADRGSPRLHGWLVGHRVFGPLIADWHANGAVSRRAKVAASLAMALSALVLFALGPSTVLAAAVTALMASVAAWLWRRPEPARS